jgi:hypothetical protein
MPKSRRDDHRAKPSDREGVAPYRRRHGGGGSGGGKRVDDRDDGDGNDAAEDEFGRDTSARRRRNARRRRDDDDDNDNPRSSNHGGGGGEGGGGGVVADDDVTPCPTFDSMNLKPGLLRGIYAHGFEKPSAIQQRAVRPIIRGRDVIAQSQSGTGVFLFITFLSFGLAHEWYY